MNGNRSEVRQRMVVRHILIGRIGMSGTSYSYTIDLEPLSVSGGPLLLGIYACFENFLVV